MFPGATILVIESHSSAFGTLRISLGHYGTLLTVPYHYPDFFFSSYAAQKQILRPVMDRVQADPTPKRLVHAFSNGGACQLAALLDFLAQEQQQKKSASGWALTPASLVLDSCPGGTDLAPACKAFTMGMPALLKYSTIAVLACLWVSLFCYDKLIASEPGHILKMRRDLNNTRLLSKGTLRPGLGGA